MELYLSKSKFAIANICKMSAIFKSGILSLFLLFASPVWAQQQVITGKVIDADGHPVPMANVTVKGAAATVQSGTDGTYSIALPSGVNNPVLVFSFIGFVEQEEVVGARTVIDVSLKEEVKSLDEVVVVGYGSVKKANLTGAVDQIRGDILDNRPIVSVPQALQGTVANLNISSSTSGSNRGGAPGSQMSLNIRGVSALNTGGSAVSVSPLVVIDGVQGGDINTISPDDIANISVLKDAASSAIYGSSAPYGVILITTKQGARGRKPVVSYSANTSWSTPINLPEMMNSLEFYDFWKEVMVTNAGTTLEFPEGDALRQRIKDYMEGKITTTTVPSRWESAGWGGYEEGNDNNDWFKLYFKNWSFSHQHNVGVQGGSENSSYYIGAGYFNKGGMYNYGNDSYNRYTVRANLSSTLNKWLTANLRSSFTRGLTDTPDVYPIKTGSQDSQGWMHNIARKWPNVPLINPDGNYSDPSEVILFENGGRDKVKNDNYSIVGELIFTPLKGWNTTVNYSFNAHYINSEYNPLPVMRVNPDGSETVIPNTDKDPLRRYSTNNEWHIINAFTSYEREKSGHYAKGLLGYVQEIEFDHQISASNLGVYSNSVPTLNTSPGASPGVGESKATLASRGVFGRINYGYKEKYLLELNGRYDGTSRFKKEHRFGLFAGASAAWVASNEKFWETLKPYVNFFKLRASYGALGDQSTMSSNYYPFYPSLGVYKVTDGNWLFNSGREAYISYPGLVDADLTWVTSTTVDFGADLMFFKNRLSATFDWFQRSSDNTIGPGESLPAVLGANAPGGNNASIKTTGFELTLGWRDRIGDFTYGIRATLADSKSVITKFNNPTKLLNNWYDGRVVGEIWGYVTEGFYAEKETDTERNKYLYNGEWGPGDVKYKDLDESGKIDIGDNTLDKPGDRKIIGNSSPRYTYGITLDAAYKGFDFSVFFQGVGKRDIMFGADANYFWGVVGDIWQSSAFTVHRDRWTPENPNGYFPKFYMQYGVGNKNSRNLQAQTKYLQDASFMRLKNMQIGYTLPKQLLDKWGIGKLRVYMSGENLLTFTNLIKTMDPELASGSGKVYPLQATWSLGLNLTF